MFKVGDFVRRVGQDKVYKVTGFSDIDPDFAIVDLFSSIGGVKRTTHYHKKHLVKWEPKEGEWCWFITVNGSILPPILMQYGEQDYDKWDFIEPFIGELPTKIKGD